MIDRPSIEIDLTPNAMGSIVRINGTEIPCIRAFRLEADVNDGSHLHLELVGVDVKVRGHVGKLHLAGRIDEVKEGGA